MTDENDDLRRAAEAAELEELRKLVADEHTELMERMIHRQQLRRGDLQETICLLILRHQQLMLAMLRQLARDIDRPRNDKE